MTAELMTKAERDDLARLVRRREKLAKSDVDRVGAERLADFEAQTAAVHRPADHEVWRHLNERVQAVVAEADSLIAEHCRELRILDEYRPSLSAHWYTRGENAAAKRRAELRLVAKTRIDADAKAAKTAIERRSVELQTELVAGGLASEEAKRFLASMPTADALMPPAPSVAEIETSFNPRPQLASGGA